jgi:hypothetical protein
VESVALSGRRRIVVDFIGQPVADDGQGDSVLSLENESGLLDLVVKLEMYEQLWETIRGQPPLVVDGVWWR